MFNLLSGMTRNLMDAGYNLVNSGLNGEQKPLLHVLLGGQRIPIDLVKEIFSHLSFKDLLNCANINKNEWQVIANDPLLLKKVIGRNEAFGPEDWGIHFGDKVISASETEEAWEKLPLDITKIFKSKCPIFPEKKIGQSNVLVWIPAGMTVNNYGELLRQKFPQLQNGYRTISNEFVDEFGDIPTNQSEWVLMSRRTVPNSPDQKNHDVSNLLINLNQEGAAYTIPTALEAIICLSTTLFKRVKIISFSLTKTKDQTKEHKFIVSYDIFGAQGVGVSKMPVRSLECYGTASIRKL